MRHLTRLYFENIASTEQFVSIVDQGVERVEHGSNAPIFNQLYNIKVGNISNPMTPQELLDAWQFLQNTPCFFKLPIGARAVVDIYIPDEIGSDAPKTFDYQVFKAKHQLGGVAHAKAMNEFREKFNKVYTDAFRESGGGSHEKAGASSSAGPIGPGGPIAATGPTGPTVSICCYSSSGPSGPSNPCGGQTSIPCPDPIFTRASCVNGTLQCVRSEPPGKTKK